jgi:hypothetical protein
MTTQTTPSEWELTSDEIKLIQKRAQLRATTKAEFLKRYRNPFYASVPGHFVSKLNLFTIYLNSFFFFNKVDPQNIRLYAYQQNSYRYIYTSPRILLAPGLFLLAGGLIQYFAQQIRVIFKKKIHFIY